MLSWSQRRASSAIWWHPQRGSLSGFSIASRSWKETGNHKVDRDEPLEGYKWISVFLFCEVFFVFFNLWSTRVLWI